jgi:hypothetical protein
MRWGGELVRGEEEEMDRYFEKEKRTHLKLPIRLHPRVLVVQAYDESAKGQVSGSVRVGGTMAR